jgi:hypothetical protein
VAEKLQLMGEHDAAAVLSVNSMRHLVSRRHVEGHVDHGVIEKGIEASGVAPALLSAAFDDDVMIALRVDLNVRSTKIFVMTKRGVGTCAEERRESMDLGFERRQWHGLAKLRRRIRFERRSGLLGVTRTDRRFCRSGQNLLFPRA